MLNSCVWWKYDIYNRGDGLLFLFHFLSGGGEVSESSTLPQQIQLLHLDADRKALCFDSGMRGFIRTRRKQQVHTSQPPLSQYHSRQIVFTPDPTTATKDPTCSSNNSKSNHIGFPFLVSKGHSLSWFFSFNSCKGIEPPPCHPQPSHFPSNPHPPHTPLSPFICSWEWGEETEDYRFALKQWANLKSPNELSLIIEIIRH